MPAAPLVIALLVAATAVAGTVVLAVAPEPMSPAAALLFAAGMVPTAVTAVSGILLVRGRWSGRLGCLVGLLWIWVGAGLDSGARLAVVGCGAAALAATAGPWLRRWLRQRPMADGVPPAAVVMLLTLLLTPALLAIAEPGRVRTATWVFASWSLALALLVARTAAGAVAAVRVLHPTIAAATAMTTPLPVAVVVAATAALVTTLAWRRDLRRAIAPAAITAGVVHRFPPELAPPEVLRAAGVDETGRRVEP